MTRTRTKSTPRPTGTRTRFGSPASGSLTYSLIETVKDEVLPGDNFDFTVTRQTIDGGVINSDYDGGYWVATFVDYPADALSNGQMQPLTDFYGMKPYAAYATEAVARTNPSRPYVDIPVNILELGDITRILKSQGDSLLKQAGGNNLRFQFGIRPIVSDLVKLTQFQQHFDRKVALIERLKGPRGYRKTVTLDNLSSSDTSTIVWQSQDVFMSGDTQRKATRLIKGHCRWLPEVDFGSISQPELSGMARRAAHGMTIDFATLWEAMPWSWFIDWFTNIGPFLMAQRNIIPARLESVSLIEYTLSESSIPRFRVDQHEMSAGTVRWETKKRFTWPVVPTAHFPFLDGNQMGILASLAVTRR